MAFVMDGTDDRWRGGIRQELLHQILSWGKK